MRRTEGSTTEGGVGRFRGGKLSHVLTVTDVMAVGRQIGAAPQTGSRAERAGVMMQRLAARKMRKSSHI